MLTCEPAAEPPGVVDRLGWVAAVAETVVGQHQNKVAVPVGRTIVALDDYEVVCGVELLRQRPDHAEYEDTGEPKVKH